jgi:hypothetical protein
MGKAHRSRIDAHEGIRIPVGAGEGLVAHSDADGDLVWRPSLRLPSIELFGHSYAAGGGSDQGESLADKISAVTDATVVNYAVGGSVGCYPDSGTAPLTARDGGWNYLYHTRNADDLGQTAPYLSAPPALIWYGIHDLAVLGPNNLTYFYHALRAMIARARCAAVFEHGHASVTKGGTWAADATGQNENSGFGYALSANTNSTITIAVPSDFPGGEVVLGFLTSSAGWGALLDIDVTGATTLTNRTHDSRNIQPRDHSTAANPKVGTSVHRIAGLNPGAHTITISVTTLNTGWYFDWWGIAANPAPMVVVAGASLPPSIGTWAAFPYPTMAQSAVDSLNAGIQAVCDEFPDDVLYWDTEDVLGAGGTAAYFASDQAHPNGLGYAELAKSFKALVASSGLLTDDRLAKMQTRKGQTYAARIYRATAQSIPNGSSTALSFDAVRWANPSDDLYWNALHPTRIYFRRGGWWNINFVIGWAGNISGARSIQLRVNGSYYIAFDERPASWQTFVNVNAIHNFASGEYVEVMVYQDSGGNLNVTNEPRMSPEITIYRPPGN